MVDKMSCKRENVILYFPDSVYTKVSWGGEQKRRFKSTYFYLGICLQ